jgi:hypothetical protein
MSEDIRTNPNEEVLELVLTGDDEFPGGGLPPGDRGEDRRLKWRTAGARFLPGVDAGALYAAAFAFFAAGTSLVVDAWTQNRLIAQQIKSEFAPRTAAAGLGTPSDPLVGYRGTMEFRALVQGGVAVVAILVAIAVLLRWQEGRHTRWSRPVAQVALGLGVLTLVFAALVYWHVLGRLPSVHDIEQMRNAASAALDNGSNG